MENLKNNDVWNTLSKAIYYCMGQSTYKMLDLKWISNLDENKSIILPYSNSTPCVSVTLGIGKDILAEKKLLTMIPGCQMYGADPIFDSGKVFKEIGTYFQIAVTDKNKITVATVLINNSYTDQKMPSVAFTDFISTNVSHKIIDYLFMDNEYAEYEILPKFHRGSGVDANDIVVCQIPVEHHNLGLKNISAEWYSSFVKDLIRNSSLLPLWSTPGGWHVRMYLFNAENEYCVKKFLQHWCHVEGEQFV